MPPTSPSPNTIEKIVATVARVIKWMAQRIRFSRRRADIRWGMRLLVVVSVTILVLKVFFSSWLNVTVAGQIQQVRWLLAEQIEKASHKWAASTGPALIKDNQYKKGINVIRNYVAHPIYTTPPIDDPVTQLVRRSIILKLRILKEVVQIAVKLSDSKLLKETLDMLGKQPTLNLTQKLGGPEIGSSVLSTAVRAAVQLGETDRARSLVEQVLAATDSIDDPRDKSRMLSQVAWAYEQLGETDRARSLLPQALAAANAIGKPWGQFSALSDVVKVYARLEEEEQTQAVLEQALRVAGSIYEPDFKPIALGGVIRAAVQLEESDRARVLLEQAVTAANTFSFEKFSARPRMLSQVAWAYGQLGEDARARAVLEQALVAADSIDSDRFWLKLGGLKAVAWAYEQLEESDRPQAVLPKILAIARSIDDSMDKSDLLSLLAQTMGQTEAGEPGRSLLKQVLAATDSLNEPRGKSKALGDIALAAEQLQEGELARAVLQQALAAANSLNEPEPQTYALSAVARRAVQLQEGELARAVLQQALAAANSLNESKDKSSALSAVAKAAGQIEEGELARAILEQVLAAATSIDKSQDKSKTLTAVAKAVEQVSDLETAKDLLRQLSKVAKQAEAFEVSSQVARSQALYGDWQAALRTLRDCQETDKIEILAQMLTYHAENQRPQLMDIPAVLAVNAVEKGMGQYRLQVKIQSPDKSCDRYTNWWEVLSEEGELLGRKTLNTPHKFECPFTTEKTIAFPDPDRAIIVRVHFSDDIDRDSRSGINHYSTQALKGMVGKPESFELIRLPARFAARVERQDPQPPECQEN